MVHFSSYADYGFDFYDNTTVPFRIFKKRKDVYYRWENKYWDYSDIEKLTGINEYVN